ncbi:MAG TPA: PilZ domain-containing protein [Polyangia bacterium]|nr:PilZ domain-containing protein [Polyangia bacterium]
MKILLARFASGTEFLEHYDGVFPWGGLLVPTRTVVAADEPLIVEVAFPELPNHVLLRGRAVDRDEDRGGLVVRFLHSEEQKKEFLLQVASGEQRAIWQRRHRRFPVRLRVAFGVEGGSSTVHAHTEDLSAGGIFLRTPMTLSVRTPVALTVDPADGSPPIEVTGHVAWVRHHPPTAGFGVTWDERSSHAMKRLRKLMRDLKTRGKLVEAAGSERPEANVH